MPTAGPTPTPSPTPDSGSVAAQRAGRLDWKIDGFDEDVFTPVATGPPGSDLPAVPTVPGGDGSLQVLEPPASSGLVDSIVGDIVASFLGK